METVGDPLSIELLDNICKTPAKYLCLVVRAILAEIVLRNIEFNPVGEVLALHRIDGLWSPNDDTCRVAAPTSENTRNRDTCASRKYLPHWKWVVWAAHG